MTGWVRALTLFISVVLLSTTTVENQGVPTIRVGVLRNGTYEVQTMPLDVYVGRVLAGEALPNSSPAALEALAIAVRTYTLTNLGKHRAEGFDVCDQTHCQVMRQSTPATDRAATATFDRVLLYRGQLATVYYSASCGGVTEKPSNVWPGAEDPPYLPSRPDPDGCRGMPEWSTELSLSDLQRALTSAGFRGTLRNVRIATRNQSGRAQQLALEGMTPNQISGQDLRSAIARSIGWQYLQSTNFELTRSGDAIRFRGRGAGHGVGMCVIGAAAMAANGRTATQILNQYFPGTTVGPTPARPAISTSRGTAVTVDEPAIAVAAEPGAGAGIRTAPPATGTPTAPPPTPASSSPATPAPVSAASGIVLALPDGDANDRASVIATIARERDALAATLGVSAPPRIGVRFHPTNEAFERATGQPWYTLSGMASGDLQFAPLATLRDRGILERTIRRQLVHLLADSAFAGRQAWVKEGAAIHFAEGTMGPPQREACPLDYELLRPASAGALNEAYTRARACYERQLNAGRKWNDIR